MARRSAAAVVAAALSIGLLGCPERPLDAARQAREAGDLVSAGEAYLRAARRDPALLGAWDGAVDVWCREAFQVARCLEVLDLELELLGNVVRHHDALSVALETRGRARIGSGLADAALEDLDRAQRAGPERASVAVARARALVMLGRREDALAALERARMLDGKLEEIDEVARLVPTPAGSAEPEGAEPGFGGE